MVYMQQQTATLGWRCCSDGGGGGGGGGGRRPSVCGPHARREALAVARATWWHSWKA